MIGLDTNVLVRYLTQDDAKQATQATRLIEQAIRSDEPLFINSIVLCELSWVLTRAYDFSKNDLAGVFEKILLARQFDIEDKSIVWNALALFKEGKADFADCLIGVKNQKAGCRATFSFDAMASTLANFSLVAER